MRRRQEPLVASPLVVVVAWRCWCCELLSACRRVGQLTAQWSRDGFRWAFLPRRAAAFGGPRPRARRATAYQAASPFALVPYQGTGYAVEEEKLLAAPRSKEGSRHKRQRARRAAARVALRLGSAAKLLGEHHSRQRQPAETVTSFEAAKRARKVLEEMVLGGAGASGSRPSSASGRALPSSSALRPNTPRDGDLAVDPSEPGPWQCGSCGIYDNWWDKARCRRCGSYKDSNAVAQFDPKGEGKKGKKGKRDKDKGGRKGGGKAPDGAGGRSSGGGPFGGSSGGNKGRDPSPLTRATQQHAESVVHWGEESPITKALAQRVDELTVEKFKQKPVASLWDEANGEVRRLEVLLAELDQKLVEARQVVDIISGEKALVM